MNGKKLLTLAVIAFLVYFVIAQPQRSAGVAHGVLAALQGAGSSLASFLQSLFRA